MDPFTSTPSNPLLTITLLLLLSPSTITLTLALPPCQSVGHEAKGYTFTLDPSTGERIWSFCEFPDPRNDHAHCGLPDWSEPAFLCDPDNLIGSEKQALAINSQLRSIQTKTGRQCTGPDGERQGFVVALVLVDRIRVGDPYSANSCTNECGEVHPTVNTSARAPTSGELDVAMTTFAEGVRRELGLGACGNDLIVLYTKEFHRVQVAMGWRAAAILDSSDLSDLESRFLGNVNDGDLEGALLHVAEQLRSDLRGVTPADILLILTLVSSALLAMFLTFYIYISDTDYNVWGHEGASKMADVAVKVATGVYAIDWLLQTTALVSQRMPLWPIILLLLAGLGCMVFFFVSNNLYTRF